MIGTRRRGRTWWSTALTCVAVTTAWAAPSWWEAYEAHDSPGAMLVSAAAGLPAGSGVAVFAASPVAPLSFGAEDRLVVPPAPALDLAPPLTIEVWCRPTAPSGYPVLRKYGFGFPCFQADGSVAWYLYGTDKRDRSGVVPGIAELGRWHHYCLTFDGATVAVFHDGSQAAATPVSMTLNRPDGPLLIGFSDGWAGKFEGDIGLVRLYAAVLTPEQVAAHCTSLRQGLPPAPGAALVFEEPTQLRAPLGRVLRFAADSANLALPLAAGCEPRQSLLAGAWVRPSTSGLATLVDCGNEQTGFALHADRQTLAAVLRTSMGRFEVRAPDCIAPDRWQNVGLAWNGRTLQLFRDGRPVGPPALAIGDLAIAGAPLRIGGDAAGTRHYVGELGEVRILPQCPLELPPIPPDVGETVTGPVLPDDPAAAPGPRSRHLEGRVEKHAPSLDFEDLAGWQVTWTRGISTGTLQRTSERRCWGEHVAKVVFGGDRFAGPRREVRLLPPAPIRVGQPFDAIDLWTYPQYWGRPEGLAMSVHLRTADGHDFEYDLSANPRWFYWTGWYLAHRKLPRSFDADTCFAGFTLHDFPADPEQVMYLDSLAFYTEDRGPLRSHVPDWDDLPTPTSPETIVPPLAEDTRFTLRAGPLGTGAVLRYADSREVMEWHYLPESGTLSDLRVSINGGELFRPAAGGGFRLAVAGREVEPDDPAVTRRLLGLEIGRTGAVARWEWRVGEVSFPVRLALAACRKSLQVELSAETDLVTEVRLGHYEGGPAAQLVRVPYLDMHGFRHASENPAIVATDTFFLSGLQDWYHSDGSELFGEAGQLAPDRAIYNGGVAYYPRTGGHRNPPRERFVYTVSSRFAEVLPAIPNPPSPWREVTGRSFWITRTWYMTPDEYEATRTGREPSYFEQESAFFRTLHGYGVRDLLVRRHTDIWRQYLPMDGDPYTFITAIDPRCGGDAGFAEHVRRLRQELGYRVGLYTNYTIVSPLTYGLWSENLVCLDSNDEWQTGSLSTAMAKVSQVLPLQRDLARTLKRTFGVSCSYQDQITCRPFWGCTDYDRRVVGAAQHSAAFRVHAKVLAEERRLYDGPVLSEGACHWYFAGLCDSNYAQTDGMATPGLLDFQLLRLHPLNDDCGEEIHQEKPDRLAAYCLAYGLTGHYAFSDAPAKNLAPEALARFLKAYFLLRPLQPCYAGVPVRQIRYADAQGNLLPTEEAIRRDVVRLGRTRVTYANGLAATVNLGQEPWLLGTGAEAITLPRNGFLVELPGKVVARRTLVDGHPAEFVDTPECIFLDGNGQHTDFGPVAAKYAYVLRREGGRLSLVPAPFREAESVTLRPGALGLPEAVVVDVVGPGAVELPGRGSSRP